mmetsp:Transcript_10064/g.29670  ORF Transcript_10064/g.29670 Transcript_10064/m.29670 type:complete len:104 (+) Transcript_10064:1463-1774(+)
MDSVFIGRANGSAGGRQQCVGRAAALKWGAVSAPAALVGRLRARRVPSRASAACTRLRERQQTIGWDCVVFMLLAVTKAENRLAQRLAPTAGTAALGSAQTRG